MTTNVRPRVLCVDDEPNLLAAVTRTLYTRYDIVTANCATAGLEKLAASPPFAVVTSDLRMPGIDGAEFLSRVRKRWPETVRLLLTGQSDLQTAAAAANEGQVFQLLVKPCRGDDFVRAIDAAAEQHRLITAERVLLEQTLHGSIKALVDLLSISQPSAFGRAHRLKRHVESIATELGVPERWQVEVAALLSQVGFVTLPPESAARLLHGINLSNEDEMLRARMPHIAEELIASIPRLDGVRAILREQDAPFDDSGETARESRRIPIGARILKVALDFDLLESTGIDAHSALEVLQGRSRHYDPVVLGAMRKVCGLGAPVAIVEEHRLADVRVGMVFANDVVAPNGLLLIARGQEVTPSLLEHVRNSWHSFSTTLRVGVVNHTAGAAPAPRPVS